MINLVKETLAKVMGAAAWVCTVVLDVLSDVTDSLLAWQAKSLKRVYNGQSGAGTIEVIVVAIVLIYVGFMLIGQFTPMLGNITSTGNTTVDSFFSMGKWLIPVLAIVALFLYGIREFMGGGGGGKSSGGSRKRKTAKR